MSRAAPLAAGLLLASWAAILWLDPWADERVNDLFVYRSYAELFLDGHLPYRDVGFEYPPLAAVPIGLAGLTGTGEEGYRAAFAVLALVLMAGLVALCALLAQRTGGDPRRAAIAAALAPLLTGAMIRTHFDLVPVLLTCGALLALCRRRTALGFALLGLGTATKLFPLVVAAPALAWLWGRGERSEARRGLVALGATLAASVALGVALSPGGFADSFEYHLDRPVQVESVPALILLGLDGLGAGTAESVNSFRSDGLLHPASDALVALFAALSLAAVAAFTLAAHSRPDERQLVLASLGAVAAFAALGKVLSPQYLIWLVPLGALAFAWRLHALAAAVALATLLTLVEFPAHYFDLVDRQAFPVALVALRDATLLAVVLLAIRESTAARSSSPARPARLRSAPR